MAIFQHFWPSGSLFWLPRPHLCMKLAPREPKDVSHIGWGWGTIRAISSQVSFADNPLLCLTRCFRGTSFFGTEKKYRYLYQYRRIPRNLVSVPEISREFSIFWGGTRLFLCILTLWSAASVSCRCFLKRAGVEDVFDLFTCGVFHWQRWVVAILLIHNYSLGGCWPCSFLIYKVVKM